ncbi:hypothetical protein EVAR_6644_1 [Eumeta japonica]|uniref:Uncharacterized protein n=1 Tax=Eumeta variegata TaxID=151549 RepID=A0A4C1TLB1_EUMVA|nr:hypothetical protein EVAR_6644_1 [Eumeta japonica]
MIHSEIFEFDRIGEPRATRSRNLSKRNGCLRAPAQRRMGLRARTSPRRLPITFVHSYRIRRNRCISKKTPGKCKQVAHQGFRKNANYTSASDVGAAQHTLRMAREPLSHAARRRTSGYLSNLRAGRHGRWHFARLRGRAAAPAVTHDGVTQTREREPSSSVRPPIGILLLLIDQYSESFELSPKRTAAARAGRVRSARIVFFWLSS